MKGDEPAGKHPLLFSSHTTIQHACRVVRQVRRESLHANSKLVVCITPTFASLAQSGVLQCAAMQTVALDCPSAAYQPKITFATFDRRPSAYLWNLSGNLVRHGTVSRRGTRVLPENHFLSRGSVHAGMQAPGGRHEAAACIAVRAHWWAARGRVPVCCCTPKAL